MRIITLVFFIAISTSSLWAQNTPYFLKNKGQWPDLVKAKSELPNGAVFVHGDGLTFNFVKSEHLNHSLRSSNFSDTIQGHSFRWKFLKSKEPQINFDKKMKGRVHLLNQSNPKSNLFRYQEISYSNVYPNIDYHIYGYGDGLKYDWVINPGGNAKQIQVQLEGIKEGNAYLSEERLIIETSVNKIIEHKPYAYQIINGDKVEVPCKFVWKKNQRLSFHFPKGYDRAYTLIIDPIMVFSSFSGSFANNFGYTATYDDLGFLYSGGTAFNIGYPITVGAYQTNYNGGVFGTDIVLSKYDTSGSFLVYSTYLGGTGDEVPHSLIVYQNELYMMGTTGSLNFPTTIGSFDNTFNGGSVLQLVGVSINYNQGCDIVVSRLSEDGGTLLASTFLGGTENDGLNTAPNLRYNYADQMRGEIDIDAQGNCYIVSSTLSNDFPIANSLIQPANNGGQEGVIVKMDNNLSNILWSTYFGGSDDDAIYSLAFDDNNDVYISGGTKSNNLSVTNGVLNSTYLGGLTDALMAHMKGDGSSLINATYFGSDDYDQAYFIELDKAGQVYTFGQTLAQDNDMIFNAAWSQPNSAQFVSKLTPDLSSLEFSTVFGSGTGQIDISPTAFLVDACNRVYCSGWGGRTNGFANGGPGGHTADLITTFDAFQSTTDSSDFYLIILEDDANTLSYASFFGGNQAAEHVDGGTSRFDKQGIVYQSVCAGCGGFSDFPTTDNAVSTVNNSSCNNAVFKYDPDFPLTVANFELPEKSCDLSLTLENLSLGDNNSYMWNFDDGTISNDTNPTHTFNQYGTFEITLISNDPLSCNLSDTIRKSITIEENSFEENDSITICKGESVNLNFDIQSNYTYNWFPTSGLSNTNNNTIASPDETTTYYLVGTFNNCYDSIVQHIEVKKIDAEYERNYEFCGREVQLSVEASEDVSIKWSRDYNFGSFVEADFYYASEIGSYFVLLEDSTCQQKLEIQLKLSDDCCAEKHFIIPNAFTPNGDLVNDYFSIEDSLNLIQSFDIQLFNRWGQKVFSSDKKSFRWDGYFKGQLQPASVFDYYLNIRCIGSSQKTIFKKGNITLIR